MMPLSRLAVLAALAAALIACQSSDTGPTAGGDRASGRPVQQVKTGLPIEPYDAGELGYVTNWVRNLDLPRRQRIRTASVLEELGLLVIVETPNNMVTGVSLRTGDIEWRQVIGRDQEDLYHAHTVNDEQLMLNSQTRLYVLSAEDGRVENLFNLESTVVSDPAVIDDFAVFGGRNGMIFTHRITSGLVMWRYRLPGSILTSPVASGSAVFVADNTGAYGALDASGGSLLWRNKTWGPVTAQPAAAPGGIYVPSRDRSLYALNRSSGNDKWIYRTTVPLADPPTPMARLIIQPVEGQGLHAVNASQGELAWTHPTTRLKPIKALEDDRLLFMDEGRLVLLSSEDGRVVLEIPTAMLDRVIPGPDDSLIAITPNGRLIRLNPRQ